MISFIIPTTGRSSLQKTLASIEVRPGDEVLVAGDVNPGLIWSKGVKFHYIACPRGNNYGCNERMMAIGCARKRYLSFMDDDDWYVKGHRAAMADAVEATPGRPILFRMQYPNGAVLWQDQEVRCGNVSTQMILVPNMPTKLGAWGPHYAGDFDFVNSWKWKAGEVVWRPEIIAQLGFNAGPHAD